MAMLVSLEEAREYLRIDEGDVSNDRVIQSALETSQSLCLDIARCTEDDAQANVAVFREAVLYATAFFYEHREDADYASLMKMLRWLLFGVRKEKF